MGAVTELAKYRTVRQAPILDACRWSEAFETIAATNTKIFFAWQRTALRFWAK